MNILVGHFMSNLGNFDRDKESVISRDDFNRLFSNTRAVLDASSKLVTVYQVTLIKMIGCNNHRPHPIHRTPFSDFGGLDLLGLALHLVD